MANRSLLPVYKMLYGRNFYYGNFDQRLEMQKAVYLLQDMGVPIGDYGFRCISMVLIPKISKMICTMKMVILVRNSNFQKSIQAE